MQPTHRLAYHITIWPCAPFRSRLSWPHDVPTLAIPDLTKDDGRLLAVLAGFLLSASLASS